MIDIERFYKEMHPEIGPEFPIAHDENEYENELIAGFEKVLRGFKVLNEICDWSELAGNENRLSDSTNYDAGDHLMPGFSHLLAEDVSWVSSCFVDFKPDQSVNLMSLYTEIINYLRRVFEENRLWGDFLDRIGGTFVYLAISDLEVENALFVAWILDLNDPASKISNDFYAETFKEIEKRSLKNSEENQVLVQRFYAGAVVVSIIATDDDVQFLVDGWPSGFVKGEWDDQYKFDQIHRNDKRAPDSKEEWLNLMAPEKGQCFELGKRSYRSLEKALQRENSWVSEVGSYFR